MSGPPRACPPPRKRLGKVGSTVIFLAAITVSLVLAQVLGDRLGRRIDVTALGDQQLSDATSEVLDRLSGEYRIVLAGPWSDAQRALGLDPRVVTQVLDVLSEIDRASDDVTLITIDTQTARGGGAYRELIAELVGRDKPALDELADAQRAVGERIGRAADGLEALSTQLAALSARSGGGEAGEALRDQLGSWASLARLLAGEVRAQRGQARTLAGTPIGDTGVMAVDEARRVLDAAVDRLDAELTGFASVLGAQREQPATPSDLSLRLASIADALGATRDELASARAAMDRVPTPDAVRIARVLGATNAALIIGPPSAGTTAIDFETLFPTINPLRENLGVQADLRAHTEQIATIALASLTAPAPPIVVFVHGEGQRFMLNKGVVDWVRSELALRGVSMLEWAPVLEPDPPSLTSLDPTGLRPVVYVAVGTDDSSSTDSHDPARAGPARAQALGRALERIVSAGDPLLLCVAPSTAPSWGGADPTTGVLGRFGLQADSGRPLLHDQRSAQGRTVSADFRIASAGDGSNPIARAIAGLPCALTWPVPISQVEPTGRTTHTTRDTLLTIDDGAWGESQWLAFRKTPRGERAGGVMPEPTPEQDDLDGPWVVAVAAQREAPGLDSPQRLVVVGSNLWFVDSQTRQPALVDGRTVVKNPGNAALFEASVWWLAGQEDQIARGPETRAVALIGPLSRGQQAAILWGLFAGVPLVILLLGLVWRLVRG